MELLREKKIKLLTMFFNGEITKDEFDLITKNVHSKIFINENEPEKEQAAYRKKEILGKIGITYVIFKNISKKYDVTASGESIKKNS